MTVMGSVLVHFVARRPLGSGLATTMPAPSPTSRPRSRLRSLLLRLALLLASLVLGVLVVEVGTRILVARKYPRIRTLDATLGWKHVPGSRRERTNEDGVAVTATINPGGWRGPLYPPGRRPGTYRVVLLGDSFMEATDVEEEELCAALLDRSEDDLEVVNLGVGGYGTVQQYLQLRDRGLSFRPDLVLVAIYDNDLRDNCVPYYAGIGPRPHAVLEGGEVRIVEDYDDAPYLAFCLPLPGASFLFRHSQLYRSLNKNVWQPHRATELRELEARDARRFDAAMRRRILLGVLDRMAALTAEHGVALALALIPTREQVHGAAAPELAAIADFAAARDLPCLSLLGPLRAHHAAGERLYFDRDIHWTREGHAAAARALIPFVQQLSRAPRRGR